jgi:hypothetical protein
LSESPNRQLEAADFALFASAYRRATGITLTVVSRPDPPDFICELPNGEIVGVELTQIRRSPDNAFWDRVLDYMDFMDPYDAFVEVGRLLDQKGKKLPQFPTADDTNILVLISCEAEFDVLLRLLQDLPLSDLEESGFDEVWLGEYAGVRQGAHREIELFGLYPEEFREVTGRPGYDQKPYG